MQRMKKWLGYSAAAVTIAAAILTPLLLISLFAHAVAATGVRADPASTGMPVRYTLERPGYRIVVHQPFHRRGLLDRAASYVQVDFTPVSALPARIAETLDLDGDGAPDAALEFEVPRDASARLRYDAQPLSALTLPVSGAGRDSFSRLITRVDERVVVRIPLRER